MPGVFPDYLAPVIRNTEAGTEMVNMRFCNGPGFVNPFLHLRDIRSPGSCFCTGSARWPPPDGV